MIVSKTTKINPFYNQLIYFIKNKTTLIQRKINTIAIHFFNLN